MSTSKSRRSSSEDTPPPSSSEEDIGDKSSEDEGTTNTEDMKSGSSSEDETDKGKAGKNGTEEDSDDESVDDPNATINVKVTLGGDDTADGGGIPIATATIEAPQLTATPSADAVEPVMMPGDIPIKFINETGETSFTVVVFMKNEDPNASETPFVAWRTIRTQTSAAFTYPSQAEVGAMYFEEGMKMAAGPFPALPGSTWNFIQESENDTPTLIEGEHTKLWHSFLCRSFVEHKG